MAGANELPSSAPRNEHDDTSAHLGVLRDRDLGWHDRVETETLIFAESQPSGRSCCDSAFASGTASGKRERGVNHEESFSGEEGSESGSVLRSIRWVSGVQWLVFAIPNCFE